MLFFMLMRYWTVTILRVTRQQCFFESVPYHSVVLSSIFISISKPFFLMLNLAPDLSIKKTLK